MMALLRIVLTTHILRESRGGMEIPPGELTRLVLGLFTSKRKRRY